jgi:hypothetical protein
MKSAAVALMLAAVSSQGSQIVCMDLDSVVSWAATIVVARVESVEFCGCEDTWAVSFEISVLQSLHGYADPSAPIRCTYSQQVPEVFIDDEGNEITEWPLVTGSGIEMFVSQGDTIVVLLRSETASPDRFGSVIRMEPLDSLESVVNLIVETSDSGQGR